MSDCATCGESQLGPNPQVPVSTGGIGFPVTPTSFADPLAYAEPAGDLTACQTPSSTASLYPCTEGFTLPKITTSFNSAAPCATMTIAVNCPDKWAYPGLLLEVFPYGYVEVISTTTTAVVARNITIPTAFPVPAGTAIRPISRVLPELDPGQWINEESQEDTSLDSVMFPVLSRGERCGTPYWKPGFKRSLCGIPIDYAASDELNAGADILLRVADSNCLRRMPPPPESYKQPVLSWSSSRDAPIWIDALNPNRRVFLYTGAVQILTIPAGVTSMIIKAWGAGGGSDYNTAGVYSFGGGGGFTTCEVAVDEGDQFSIIVGRGGFGGGVTTAIYGFGGPGSGAGTPTINPSGGGLSGVFTGTAALTANDDERAVAIAGGGGGSRASNVSAATGLNGTAGNRAAADQANMQGLASAVGGDDGGGGGGYRGGNRRMGGTGFTDPGADDDEIIEGVVRYAVRTNDPDYQAGTNTSDRNGAVVITMIN